MSTLTQDLRYGTRAFLKAPGFTLLAILVLAIGIGANSAMFTIANALLFRPLAGRAGELVGLFSHDRTRPDSYRAFSYPNYTDIRDRADVFDGLMAHTFAMVGEPAGDTTRRSFAELVSSNYFEALGVRLAAGRTFSAEEERPGSRIPVAIVGYDRWKRAGLDPAFIGQTVRINAQDFTVVGVAPPGFTGTMALVSPETWLPLGMFDSVVNDIFKNKGSGLADRSNDSLVVAGRLKDGITPAAAQARLDALSKQLEEAFPAENRNQTLTTSPLPRMSTSTSPQTDTGAFIGMGMLVAIASAVQLIACLNIANMLLARGAARRREIAIRLALGGARLRIVQQLMTESLMLAIAGAAGGLLLAYWSMRVLAASLGAALPLALHFDPRPDVNVLAATIVAAIASTVLFGLGPALRLARADIVGTLKDAGGERRDSAFGRMFGMRNLLVIGQLALAVPLLTTAGLFARGAVNASLGDPGYSYDRALLVGLDPSLAGADEPHARAVYARILERIRTTAGVEAAGMASTVAFGDIHEGREVERIGVKDAGRAPSATYRVITADYFRALGLAPLRGREFTAIEETSPSAPPVAIIDEPLARTLFADVDPIGEQIRLAIRPGLAPPNEDLVPLAVVGVVPGLRSELFDQTPGPHLYVPAGRYYRSSMYMHVRAARPGTESELLGSIRTELRAIDPRMPVLELSTMRRFHEKSLELWLVRAGGGLFTVFGVLALLLAVVGVYGVKAYVVSQRTREIGIRLALGARPADVRWLVLRDGVWLTAIGLGVGLPIAALVGQLLGKLLYQVSPHDPLIFTTGPLILAATSMLATYVPARRATAVTPLLALRAE
jgi:putative ABC transport system permease protein